MTLPHAVKSSPMTPETIKSWEAAFFHLAERLSTSIEANRQISLKIPGLGFDCIVVPERHDKLS
jgi:hypothetical protein